ncbi:MAG TPA: MFS transporter [Pseudonocardiaceae bacterium]|jgi:MFS family permease|nr:MFS transporter [Pseudonocardiaceae bacterium]
MTTSPTPPTVEPESGVDQTTVTPMRRFIPAIMLAQLGFSVAVIPPLQLLLALRLDVISGANATSAFSVVAGSGALCTVLFSPVAGRVSDRTHARLGRRRTWMVAGSVLLALALVAMTATTAVWQVVVLWCLAQVAGNFQYAANNAIVADQIPPERRGGVSGLIGLVTALSPILGLGLANTFPAGGAGQWIVIATVALGVSLAGVLLFRDPRSTAPKRSPDLRTLARTLWLNPRRHPAFGWAWLVRFLIMCAYSSFSYTTFFLMNRFGVSAAKVGTLLLAISLAAVACVAVASVVAGYVSDALKRQRLFVIFAGVFAAIALVVLSGANSLATVFLAYTLLGLAIGTFLAVDLALCVRVLPSVEDAGKDLAIINLANSLPQSLVPFAAPVLLAIGGYPALFLTLAVLALLGAVAVLRVPEVGRENAPGRAAPVARS